MPIPQHVAVIMDGNGRWAQLRGQSRSAGHREGVKATRALVENAGRADIAHLTVFAFSSENWQRPAAEVSVLMDLFMRALGREMDELHANGVRVRFIGQHQRLSAALRGEMQRAEQLTSSNPGLCLNIAVGYGGRDDIVSAARAIAQQVADGNISPAEVDEAMFQDHLALAGSPPPDLFIRTGGEQRISNFLMWDLAYTELFFTDTLWPDFAQADLDRALAWFADRQRRFGRVLEQAS